MVSPLRTWQHTEPKGLWPAVGGLAVMTHVGIIGLSLPYVAGMVNGGGRSAVVPIELIVETDIAATDKTAPVSPEPVISDQAIPSERVASKPNTATTTAAPQAVKQATPTVVSRVVEAPVATPSAIPPEQLPSTPEPNNQDVSNRPAEPENAAEVETPLESPETDSPETPNETPVSEEQEAEQEASTDDSPLEESTELPPVLGGEPLPAPGSTPTEQDADQLAALSFSSHTLVADEFRKDIFATTPPIPRELFTTAARPQDVGCSEVSAPPPMPLTYRVAISTEGSIQAASPWTGSNLAPTLSDTERSIVCLLERSGWRFTPATDADGSAIPYSDLLLTFTLELGTD